MTDSLRILVLGGTGFLGPHVVDAARTRGHVLTLFNRGRRAPDLLPDVEAILGDRDGGLDALGDRKWDAVIDNCGYVPRVVSQSAKALAGRVGLYVFVSSISVYADSSRPGRDESSPVERLPSGEESSEDVAAHYGALKALCEEAVERAHPKRTARIRPGLIVGPGDPTDRFTYWPVRMARGGVVAAPGEGADPVQIIDVRDLAAWMVTVVERSLTGIYNATGPASRLVMRDMLDACRVPGVRADLQWLPWKFLEENGIAPWSDMPAWVPPVGENAGLGQTDCTRAIEAGLRFRPVSESAHDTLEWFQALPPERQASMKAGLTPDRESALLAKWRW